MIDRYFLMVMIQWKGEYSRDERGRSQLAMRACKHVISPIVVMILNFYMHVPIVKKLPGTISHMRTHTIYMYPAKIYVDHWKNPLLSVIVNLVFCMNMQAGRGGLRCHGDGDGVRRLRFLRNGGRGRDPPTSE